MNSVLISILWAILFSAIGVILGIYFFIRTAAYLPKLFDRLTPNIDEGKEIIRGNTAVAEYYGRIVSAGILGVSLIIATTIAAGIIVGLH